MELKTILGGSIHTNSYLLIEDNRALIVDYVPETGLFLKNRGIVPEVLLITHIHFDHIERLEDFLAEYPGLAVYISAEGKAHINDPQYSLNYEVPYHIAADHFHEVGEDALVEWHSHQLKVVTTPGHSIDSVVFVCEEINSVFCGDTVFFRSVGRTDFPGGSFEILMASINKLFGLYSDDMVLYPGHGPKTTIGGEKKNNSFIRSFI